MREETTQALKRLASRVGVDMPIRVLALCTLEGKTARRRGQLEIDRWGRILEKGRWKIEW